MAAKSISFSATAAVATTTDDACGAAVTEVSDCLVRPRYFCGQLLTDRDLTALLEWAQGKHRLDRHKHGWGVVHGLQVQCDAGNRSRVRVTPGYAVDAAGNDILVCGDALVDLTQACPGPEVSCKELLKPGAQADTAFLGLDLPPGQIAAVDLYLRYREQGTLPLPALARKACGERDACEFSRTEETYSIDWCYADTAADALDRLLLAWEEKYFTDTRKVYDEFMRWWTPSQARDVAAVQGWLRAWMERQPPQEFGFLRDAVEGLAQVPPDPSLEPALARLLFFLVQDRRNAYLQAWPQVAAACAGVPIARVWMYRQAQSGAPCVVLQIDDFPYPRRELAVDRWPAPAGHVNLGRHIWQRAEQVCQRLWDLGLRPTRMDGPLPQTLVDLGNGLGQNMDLGVFRLLWPMNCTDAAGYGGSNAVRVYVYREDVSPFGERVFGFAMAGREYIMPATEGSSVSPKPTAVPAAPEKVTAAAGVAVKAEAVAEEQAVAALTAIRGVTKDRALKLQQNGVRSTADLAAMKVERLQELFPRVKPEELVDWLSMAKKATP
jgi:hypothetical protein